MVAARFENVRCKRRSQAPIDTSAPQT